MSSRAWGFVAAVVLLLYPHTAGGSGTVTVQYSLVSLGGNIYRYVYSIYNNGSLPSGAPIGNFEILFDPSLYATTCVAGVSTACIVTATVNPSLPSQWEQTWLSGVGENPPPTYDALAFNGNTGISAGTTVSGFAVQFTWLGSGQPGSQPFEIYDPNTFQLLQTGQTVASSVVGVPTSSTLSLALIAAGLALGAANSLRVRNRRMQPLAQTAERC